MPTSEAPASDMVVPPSSAASSRPSPLLVFVRCVNCGYDLKGIAPDSACPECGMPASFRETMFTAAWPRDLFRWYASVYAIWCILLGYPAVRGFFYAMGDSSYNTQPRRETELVVLGVHVVGMVLAWFVAWWALRPRRSTDADPVDTFPMLALATVVLVVAAVLGAAPVVLPWLAPLASAGWLLCLCIVVAMIGHRTAVAMGVLRLWDEQRRMMWGVVIIILTALVFAAGTSLGVVDWPGQFFLFSVAAAWLCVALGLMASSVRVLQIMRRQLRRAGAA